MPELNIAPSFVGDNEDLKFEVPQELFNLKLKKKMNDLMEKLFLYLLNI